jgi:hypothetical protein
MLLMQSTARQSCMPHSGLWHKAQQQRHLQRKTMAIAAVESDYLQAGGLLLQLHKLPDTGLIKP